MRSAILLVVLIATTQVAAAQAAVRPPGDQGPFGNERLSDELTVTRWSGVLSPGLLMSKPTFASRGVGRLRLFTENRRLEIYLVLSSRVDDAGRTWLRVRIPGRPNGRTGWTVAGNLERPHVVRTRLLVNRSTLRATLYLRGRRVWTSRIGVGKAGTPTPAGRFWVRERLRNLAGKPLYGPWAFGTSAYAKISDWPRGGVVGIHGTDQPQLIPGRPSHGCVRVPNGAIRRLARLMPLGTPILIL